MRSITIERPAAMAGKANPAGLAVLAALALAGGVTTSEAHAWRSEVVASELGLDVSRVDLAGVVSKYIGGTEKDPDRVFAAAEGTNAVPLFDEPEGLFRSRYAHIETN